MQGAQHIILLIFYQCRSLVKEGLVNLMGVTKANLDRLRQCFTHCTIPPVITMTIFYYYSN